MVKQNLGHFRVSPRAHADCVFLAKVQWEHQLWMWQVFGEALYPGMGFMVLSLGCFPVLGNSPWQVEHELSCLSSHRPPRPSATPGFESRPDPRLFCCSGWHSLHMELLLVTQPLPASASSFWHENNDTGLAFSMALSWGSNKMVLFLRWMPVPWPFLRLLYWLCFVPPQLPDIVSSSLLLFLLSSSSPFLLLSLSPPC